MDTDFKDNTQLLKTDHSTLALMHYSQLLNFMGFLGLIIPIVLWSSKKNEIKFMDEHGKQVVNFQLSLLLYTVILSFLFFISFMLMFIFVGFILAFLLILFAIPLGLLFIIPPILGGVAASKGQSYKYPLTIRFFS